MSSPKQSLLKNIPPVEALLADPQLQRWSDRLSRDVLRAAVRTAVAGVRERLLAESPRRMRRFGSRCIAQIIAAAVRDIRTAMEPQYQKAINATGVILHTGLGRAVLPPAALQHIVDDLSGYSVLQVDLETGRRGSRETRIQWLLQQLTGAEAATVVNNNAAATSLVLNTIAAGKEVIVSRGQLVEIGGSFRLPEVMQVSGARLVDVGHDQQDASARLRASHHRAHGRHHARASEQLQDLGVHQRGAAQDAGRNRPRARHPRL